MDTNTATMLGFSIFFLLLTITILGCVVMYWAGSKDSAIRKAVEGYLDNCGKAKVIRAQAELEAAKRSGIKWDVPPTAGELSDQRLQERA